MIEVRTIENIYPALEELIALLNESGHQNVSDILDHRMHKIAWTSRSESLEELQSILKRSLESDPMTLPRPLRDQLARVLFVINDYLLARNADMKRSLR